MKNVFVVGSGIMGRGIAQICAQSGYMVCVMDLNEQMLQKAIKAVEWSLNKMEEKKILKEDAGKILSRIKPVKSLSEAKEASIVIEAIFEDLRAKQTLFKKLEEICKKEAIFGTNTSSIPIIDIASASDYSRH